MSTLNEHYTGWPSAVTSRNIASLMQLKQQCEASVLEALRAALDGVHLAEIDYDKHYVQSVMGWIDARSQPEAQPEVQPEVQTAVPSGSAFHQCISCICRTVKFESLLPKNQDFWFTSYQWHNCRGFRFPISTLCTITGLDIA